MTIFKKWFRLIQNRRALAQLGNITNYLITRDIESDLEGTTYFTGVCDSLKVAVLLTHDYSELREQ
jgi:hypothetical protein